MTEIETLTEGLGRTLDAEELAFVKGEVAQTIADGVADAFQECGEFGQALDCLIISARAYLSEVERMRELYIKGLH